MHIEPILRKVNKEISILKNLRHTLPRKPLLTIAITNYRQSVFETSFWLWQYNL